MNIRKCLRLLIGIFTFLFIFFLSPLPINAQFSGDLGSISGTVKWGTISYPGRVHIAITGNTAGFNTTSTSVNFNTGTILPPDTYTVTTTAKPQGDVVYSTPLGTQTVTVSAGQAISGVTFDAFNLIGLVKGSLKVNGVPTAGYVQFCGPQEADPCFNSIRNSDGPWFDIAGNGLFTADVRPGNYRAHVVTQDLIHVGIVPVTITAGQILEDTSLQFSLQLSSVSGSVTWGTVSYPGRVYVTIEGNTTGFNTTSTSVNFNTGSILPPDTYTITAIARPQGDAIYSTTIGTQTVTVVAGQAVTGINFDAFNLIGLVKGSLKINGVSAAGYVQFCGPLETDPCLNNIRNSDGPWFDIGANGLFTADLRPGNYRAHVVTSDLIDVGKVPVTVSAGQILEDPSLQFSLNLGSISGTVRWGTEIPHSVFVDIVGNAGFSKSLTGADFNTGTILPPDTYTVSASIRSGSDPRFFVNLGNQTVTVVAGQAVTGINFDAFNVAGMVKGSLKINGIPAPGYVQFCGPLETDPCPNTIDNSNGPWVDIRSNGLFTAFILPGQYRAHALTENLVHVGIVPVTVTAGQILDLTTTSVNVPVGQDVRVSLGGVTVTFSEVTSSGIINLTITTQPQGGLPPSEYRLLGTYYELTTTAVYTGPVTVSFVYNEADVRGLETNLKLFHWDGTSWQDITVPPIDTINNIITGVTQTLSPFVVGEFSDIPLVGSITAPIDPQLVNQVVNVSASFTDPGISVSYTAVWDWGDGTTSAGTVDQANKFVSSSHVYLTPGIYTLRLEVTKDNGGTGKSVFQYIVVYNPEGGFVTGGGSIDSPIGAFISDPTVTGKANFGFISKYEHGANIPSGQTEFHFKVANLNFHSTTYDWLVTAGAHAKYKGSGTINGIGDYAFILTATDSQISGGGETDKFRIKIWNKADNQVIYDNQLRDSDDADATMIINNGNIIIHK